MGPSIRTLAIAALTVPATMALAADMPKGTPNFGPDAFQPRATIAEIMEGMVMPSANVIWNATAVDVTEQGVVDHSPKNDEEWEHVEWAGIELAEALNALVVPGRLVDKPGVVSKYPDNELNPADIQALIAKEPEVWVGFVHGLDATVKNIQQAIADKDLKKLSDLGGALDEECENCHLTFWYPNNKQK